MSEPLTIAIDGPVASGKTVVGRLLAQRLECRFLDTGVMYRAVTWAAIQRGTDLDDEAALTGLAESVDIRLAPTEGGDRLTLNGRDITDHLRDTEVERGVSPVSTVSGVRSALVAQQRAMAEEGSIVMVGRDIGTVVLPDARVKVFLKASVAVRARRRLLELTKKGLRPEYGQVVDDLMRRDKIDSERADSPLRPAEDAIELDTDHMDIDEVVRKVAAMVEKNRC